MARWRNLFRGRLAWGPIAVGLGAVAAGCTGGPSMLDARGPGAAEIARLWWIMLAVGAAVYVAVLASLAIALLRRRRDDGESASRRPDGTRVVILAGAILPAIILAATFLISLRTMAALAEHPRDAAVTIEVIGYQFWWEVRYPDHQIVTANELHIPVGQPVRLVVTSADVIHSFWVPQLTGKIDMIPGRTNTLWLEASESGAYYGECAEFCGIQHAKMALYVIAEPAAEYAAWLDRNRQPAAMPTDLAARRGYELFLASCIDCHAVQGTPATARKGPDLTHLADRRSLAAGTLRNNRGNLAAWIVDPQGLKPGNLMPATVFQADELLAIVTYLESLK